VISIEQNIDHIHPNRPASPLAPITGSGSNPVETADRIPSSIVSGFKLATLDNGFITSARRSRFGKIEPRYGSSARSVAVREPSRSLSCRDLFQFSRASEKTSAFLCAGKKERQ